MHSHDDTARRVLAATAWFGALLQLWLSIRLALANGKSIADGVLVYSGYFTVVTNVFVAIVASAPEAAPRSAIARWSKRGSVVGCATTSIVLVGIGYHLVWRQLWSPQGAQWLADVVLHYVVPTGTVAFWAVFARDERLA